MKSEKEYQWLQEQIETLREYKSLIQALIEEKQMALEIDRGIANQEFQVFFQPQVDVKTLELVGAEALIRWKHPEKGYIAPDRFIPWCESSGMIEHIDEMVFEEVCRCIPKLVRQDERKVPIGVNVSRVTLMNPKFVTRCQEMLTQYKVKPQQIEVEVTESALVEQEHRVIESIKQFKALGCRVALDDFGAGYSSFGILQRIAIDTIKLDRSLVSQVPKMRKSCIVLASLVKMAKDLGMRVVAEGIEECAQLHFVQQIECESIQGFLASGAISFKAYEEYEVNIG